MSGSRRNGGSVCTQSLRLFPPTTPAVFKRWKLPSASLPPPPQSSHTHNQNDRSLSESDHPSISSLPFTRFQIREMPFERNQSWIFFDKMKGFTLFDFRRCVLFRGLYEDYSNLEHSLQPKQTKNKEGGKGRGRQQESGGKRERENGYIFLVSFSLCDEGYFKVVRIVNHGII